jgi:hypothetical protein
MVQARAVLFEDDEMTLLPLEGDVIEISEFVRRGSQDVGHLPRKAVADLKRGDVIVLRLTGSGDYLDSVADELMRKAGRSTLRAASSVWRSALSAAIRREGSANMLQLLTANGFSLRGSSGYLENYAAGIVIGPSNEERFGSLIRALNKHGYLAVADLDPFIREHWTIIEDVRSYQRKAAGVIRHQLLEALAEHLREGQLTARQISLTGVAAGELGLLRIADVDPNPVTVSIRQLYRIESSIQRVS